MAHAQAGSPEEVCFSVKVDGVGCEEPPATFHCITPVAGNGGCDHVTVISANEGESWLIDIGSCRFLEGAVKSGTSCCPLTIPPGTTGVITAPRCASGPHGQLQDITGVELTFCCDV
jgi:hypothetical protein